MLETGVGGHCHERMAVKAVPGSSLEVVETEFLFQLLRRLLVFLKCAPDGGQIAG
jgi:hypothetical protein